MHVGVPRNSAGWLVYIPSTGSILVSQDVSFDEDFLSTVAYTRSRIPGGIEYQPPSHPAFGHEGDIQTTENPSRFAVNEDAPGVPFDPTSDEPFVPSGDPVEELYDYSLLSESEGERLHSDIAEIQDHIQEHILDPSQQQVLDISSVSANKPKQLPRRSARLQQLKQVFQAKRMAYPSNLEYIRRCFQTEVQDTLEGMNPDEFLPSPTHWKQILKLPERQLQAWLKSFHKELKLLIVTMKCFAIEQPNDDDPLIPVTAKFRTKIKSDGTIDKLKTRVCLRGDQQAEMTDFDTWCAIGTFRDLRLFPGLRCTLKMQSLPTGLYWSISSSYCQKSSLHRVTN